MTINRIGSLVHCHVCPLKGFCTSGSPDASWRIQHSGQILKKRDKVFTVQPEDSDFEIMNKTTANCPLRRAVAYVDTKLMKDVLRTM